MSGILYHGIPPDKFQIFQICKFSKFVKSAILDFENAKKKKKTQELLLLKKTNFTAPFYGWGSTTSRLEPLRGGSLLFTTKSPEIPGIHLL